MTELLPCPFCGGKQTYRKHDGGVWLTTTNHKRDCIMREALSFVAFATEAEAIAAWNTRAERKTINKTGDIVTHDSRAEMDYEDAFILLDELGAKVVGE